jgi:putative tryptophan/tyrosine transport system substrate-binding protein
MRHVTPPARRLVLAVAGASLLPRLARTQPVKRHRIATLAQGSHDATGVNWEAFRQGLRALGYGAQDIEIENRWADGHAERLPELAAELARLRPEVVVVGSAAAIPIVATVFSDPETRAVSSLSIQSLQPTRY